MADMSISGIASGIDWDGIVSKLMEKAKAPAYVMLDKRDKLENKKSYFEEFKVALQNLQSALAPLKMASTFKAKQIEIERMDYNSSYKNVLTAKVNADAAINVYDLEVLQLAKSQVTRSAQISGQLGSRIPGGLSSSFFYVNAGGKKVRIEVSSTDTLEDVANRINRELNAQSIAVTASVLDNKLILKSTHAGLGTTTQKATVTRSVNSWDALEDFPVDLGVNGGTVVVKGTNRDGTATEFRAGVDFDIVNNQIRWREYEPQYVTTGSTYQVTYEAKQYETFKCSGMRSLDGNLDENVLPFDASTHPGDYTIKSGNTTYSSAAGDFTVEGNNIRWANGKGPGSGAAYTVTYEVAADGEEFVLNVRRGGTDKLAGSSYADFMTGTMTVSKGNKTYTRGVDFDVVMDGTEAVISWRDGAGYGAPALGDSYDVKLTKADGTVETYTPTRYNKDEIDLTDYGFTGAGGGAMAGMLSTATWNGTNYSGNVTFSGSGSTHYIDWTNPGGALTLHSNVPKYASEYTVEYTYNTNTFTLSDDGNGILSALELDLTDGDHYTAAQDAVMLLDGERVTRSSNYIGSDYGNELIKGMTIELKGTGRVSMDVSQDAEAAVTAVQNFLTSYNDVMGWINTVISQKEVDQTTKATLDSDDFRMKWGVLYGNSLLRDAKGNMRRLTSQVYTSPFTSRTSRKAVYGAMSSNGIVNAGSFTVTVGARTATIAVNPGDTLADIVSRINSSKIDGENNPLRYDSEGREYPTPYAKAEIVDNKLVITAGTDRPVTLKGNSVLSALGLNYQYTMLSQIGIGVKSTGAKSDLGLSGQLDFSTGDFMTALEKNADDVALLVTSFAGEMQTWLDNMIKSTGKEVASNVTAAQGAVVREMNAIDEEIKSIDKYLADFQKRLQTKQEGLYAQFSAAEVNLSKLMQQASWLSSVTAQLQQAGSK